MNKITIIANHPILDVVTGEIFVEPAVTEEIIDGKKKPISVYKPMTIGGFLSRYVAEGIGMTPEKKFTCSLLGGKLYDHSTSETYEEGTFSVTSDQLTMIKTILENIKFKNNDDTEKDVSWLKASILFLLDPETIQNEQEKEFFVSRYNKLNDKINKWNTASKYFKLNEFKVNN